MFASGSAVVQSVHARPAARASACVLNEVPNNAVSARPAIRTATAVQRGQPPATTNWELSAERANASRRELIAGGMGEDRQGAAGDRRLRPSGAARREESDRSASTGGSAIVVLNLDRARTACITARAPISVAEDEEPDPAPQILTSRRPVAPARAGCNAAGSAGEGRTDPAANPRIARPLTAISAAKAAASGRRHRQLNSDDPNQDPS